MSVIEGIDWSANLSSIAVEATAIAVEGFPSKYKTR
jgi:hypothetical protein